jgi:hypothetical protein
MGLRVWSEERITAGAETGLEKGEMVTAAKSEITAPDAQPVEEQRMMESERLAEMPLESLLYYIPVGEGRKRSEPAAG